MRFGVKEHREVLERFYEDRADIFHPETVRQGAVVRTQWAASEENVACSLSRIGNTSSRVGNKSGRRDAVQEILWDAVLFLAPEQELRPGDRVRVRQLGRTMEFEVVGRPALYETHQEALLREKRSA